jgi:hypothetical protein
MNHARFFCFVLIQEAAGGQSSYITSRREPRPLETLPPPPADPSDPSSDTTQSCVHGNAQNCVEIIAQ